MANCIAFSARGAGHTSYGNDDLLEYQTTILNEGGAWDSRDFTAPEDGCYHFALSFVKDSYYHNGTTDDVFVRIYHNGAYKGRGWSGEGSGKRGTGALALTLKLNAGDKITTKAGSDGGHQRHVAEYFFTGFKVG